MAIERLGLAERLRPQEADELVPARREAKSDDHGCQERCQHLEGPDQAGRRPGLEPEGGAAGSGPAAWAAATRSMWRASQRRLAQA